MKEIISSKIKDGVIRVNGSPVIPFETKRTALIVGSAPCVWKDLDFFETLSSYRNVDIALVNLSCLSFFREAATYLITLHPELARAMKTLRKNRSKEDLICHSIELEDGVDFAWTLREPQDGFSGFFAARVLVALGYKKVIVVGCPNDESGHFYDDPWHVARGKHPTHINDVIRSQIRYYSEDLQGKLKGASGFIMETYGKPTAEWLSA